MMLEIDPSRRDREKQRARLSWWSLYLPKARKDRLKTMSSIRRGSQKAETTNWKERSCLSDYALKLTGAEEREAYEREAVRLGRSTAQLGDRKGLCRSCHDSDGRGAMSACQRLCNRQQQSCRGKQDPMRTALQPVPLCARRSGRKSSGRGLKRNYKSQGLGF